ncbi:RNA-directed DNA polymerase [Salimicrobium flavidum]|uniref:Reverse transcriptase (RNA-dependent DNA polymerase) n=1 Tax=Salimicrobium flavidum TaxID=570947 RepID=A0A1N7KV52_9BACI|nr:RNA-directed DNA polymerase [Salimicrobium flavidum]SIS65478.1 Reverse transcriptase (RNA-dependent DNA polymerase) [Salimicrobium flavidum]
MVEILNIPWEEQLIKYGFFSEHIPPCFHTGALYEHYKSLKTSAEKNKESEPLSITVAKSDSFRRTIKVPNPEQQMNLFEYIIENRTEIESFLSNNPNTLANPIKYGDKGYDTIHLFDIPVLKDKKKIRSTFIENLATKLKISLGYKFVYKLDLSNFYDSIYTHSVEWAIIGKEDAKENKKYKTKKNNLGEKLDYLVRNTNNNETSGIPTGPFTSRIISEMILNKIDEELRSLKDTCDFDFVHFVDDYEFYFRSEADYKLLKNSIRMIFEKYRLKLNENKTYFMSYPYHHNIDLQEEFSHYIERYKNSKKNHDARLIFFKADELTKSGEKGAYKYLYKQLEKVDLSHVWEEIEPFIIGHMLVKPSLAQYIINLIVRHKDFVTNKLKEELKVNLRISVKDGLESEAEWLFWVLNILKVKFSEEELVFLLQESEDDLLNIMLIDIACKTQTDSKVIHEWLNNTLEYLSNKSIRSEKWLIIYEWIFNKWPGYQELEEKMEEAKYFKALRKRKINFFHPIN